MPTFEITTADGSVYQIDATDETTALGALKFNPQPKPPVVDSIEQRDAAHQQARDWLDAHPNARHGYANNLLAQGVQGATLGWADEARAAIGAARDVVKDPFGRRGFSDYYDLEKAMQDQQLKDASKSTGMAGTAAEIAGSFLPGAAISRGVGAIASRAFPAARTTQAASTLPAISGATEGSLPALASLQPAATTAAQRGFSGLPRAMTEGAVAGSIQGVGDDSNATYGGMLGAAGGGIGYGLGRGLERLAGFTNTAPRVAQAATTDDLKNAAQSAYDRFTNAGGVFTQQGLNDLAGSVRNRLTDMQWQPELAPKVTAFNRAMERARVGSGAPSGTASLNQTAAPEQILNLRKIAGKISNSKDATESSYGQAIKEEIDNFLATPREGNYASIDGSAPQEQLASDLAEANRLWTQFSKADIVDEGLRRAELRAASTYSGGNENNAMRQELRRIYEARGPENFTPDERAAFETAIRGGRVENVARMLGKLAPSRGGLSTWANIGAGAGTGGATLPLTALAEGAKVVGDRATRRNLEEVSRVIRGGGNRLDVNVSPNQLQLLMRRLAPLLAAPSGAATVRGLL